MEVNIGILCSCLPTLKGCITKYFPRILNGVLSTPEVVKIANKPQQSRARAGDGNEIYAASSSHNTSGKAVAWPGSGNQENFHEGDKIHAIKVIQQEVDLEGTG
jgi:hypothetical protein